MASAEIDGGCPVTHRRTKGSDHLSQPLPQGIVHDRLEAVSAALLNLSEQGNYIGVQCQPCSHFQSMARPGP